MIYLPIINPNIITIAGVLQIKWYGFMYVLGFYIAWLLGRSRIAAIPLSDSEFLDYLTWFAFGILIGGRLGYVVFYDFTKFWQNPLEVFALWRGGMAFHGALLGGFIALHNFAYVHKRSTLRLIDFTVPLLPPGLFLGRLGNFINGELWGRPTTVPWAMIFPYSDGLPRHPSQLYEMLGEGLLLHYILSLYRRRSQKANGLMGAWFLLHYGWIRFIIEFFREPDKQLGFVVASLSMGQCLCLGMILSASIWFAYSVVAKLAPAQQNYSSS